MNNLRNHDINLYFKGKVILLRNELINLGTFNEDIKATGINLTENFAVFASYNGGKMYINTSQIRPEPKILNNIKKVTSFVFKDENTNPTTKKKIDKLYDISEKIRNLRKLI